MAILSLSQEGLQNSLNKLETYCKEWHLVVSIKKTKIVVFNKTGNLLKGFVFKYGGKHLELVREFKYLGITVTASGGLYSAREKLRKQTNKAYFPMLRVLQKINFDTTTSLKFFDSLIKPILTYNCELWSQISRYKLESLECNKLSLEETYFDNPAEKLHLQFCRTVLGVSNKTSNLATLGELARQIPINATLLCPDDKILAPYYNYDSKRFTCV